MKKEKRILSIGAHPDDADTYCGGLLSKLRDKGWCVCFPLRMEVRAHITPK